MKQGPVVELVAIGSELLGPTRVDTDALTLARALEGLGLALSRKTTVADRPEPLRVVLCEAIARADLLMTTGGLGPTVDDLTRQILSECTGIPLRYEPKVERAIRARFAERRIEMPENNLVQAWVPERGRWFPNHFGTAPGLVFEPEGKLIVALPGPPRELEPMLERYLLPLLEERFAQEERVLSKELHTAHVSESWVDATLRGALSGFADVEVSMLARPGYVDVWLSRRVPRGAATDERLRAAHAAARAALSPHVYSDGEETLPMAVGRRLREAGKRLAVAESCTGGLIGAAITEVPGSSQYFLAGLCTYANEAKLRFLGVPEALLVEHGAVSGAVAEAMARGVRAATGADYALATTGIAGPGGGTAEKPVGLVYIAVADAERCLVEEVHFGGGREVVRQRAVAAALDILRRFIMPFQEKL
ncbi:competence/damage-inducible protein A [bacterium]|nr:competence/damage-inducible protein A [bacterium]